MPSYAPVFAQTGRGAGGGIDPGTAPGAAQQTDLLLLDIPLITDDSRQ